MSELVDFRAETKAWLAENCPPGARGPGPISNGSTKIKIDDTDTLLWLERMVEKGWTVPSWPKEYGGGGLTNDEYLVLLEVKVLMKHVFLHMKALELSLGIFSTVLACRSNLK